MLDEHQTPRQNSAGDEEGTGEKETYKMMIVLGLSLIHAGVQPRNNQVIPSFLNELAMTEETDAEEEAFII